MDSNYGDRDPNLPRASREELEDALKWLEELTSKQKLAEGEIKEQKSDPLADSPFYGILDATEEDLPDWLREASNNLDNLAEGEMESRLDWLAKMAQRESIEELPTLEWRRFHSSAQFDSRPSTPTEPDDTIDEIGPEPEEAIHLTEGSESEPGSLQVTPVEVVEPEFTEGPIQEPVDLKSFDDLDAAMAWIEELAASQEAPVEDLPSVADRALASKLLMEAGLPAEASEENILSGDFFQIDELEAAPLYSISDEDPADTVVLMETIVAESGQAVESAFDPPLESIDQIDVQAETQESGTEDEENQEPVVEAAIVANEIIAKIEDESQFDLTGIEAEPEEIPIAIETTTPDLVLAEEGEMSFEEAIAYLEEIATSQAEPEKTTIEALAEISTTEEIVEGSADLLPEGLLADTQATDTQAEVIEDGFIDLSEVATETLETDQPDIEEQIITAVEAETMLESQLNGSGLPNLEVSLLAIDALASPVGRDLRDIDYQLGLSQSGAIIDDRPVTTDLLSVLDWLEASLSEKPTTPPAASEPLADEDLLRMMPEDPDEALAWLVRMASDDEDVTPVQTGEILGDFNLDTYPTEKDESQEEVRATELLVHSKAEAADLMEMPDDPDQAMAWLESLADNQTEASQPPALIEQPAASEEPQQSDSSLPKVVEEKPSPVRQESPRKPSRRARPDSAWIDMLKPLEK